jgi:hypothetical protein
MLIKGVLRTVGSLIGIHMRDLTFQEKEILGRVFKGTVPLDRLMITSLSGVSNRPFTIPGSLVVAAAALVPPLMPIASIAALVTYLHDVYLLNMGHAGFANALNFRTADKTRQGATLVHETTHAWQGLHGQFSWWYIFSSLYNQVRCGEKAYDYSPGRQWRDYGAEQQAHLVEDWYALDKEAHSGDRYPYMKSNIWPGRGFAFTDLLPNKLRSGLAKVFH